MTITTIDLPDFVRAYMLLGKTDEDVLVPVLIDDAGQMNILVRGAVDADTAEPAADLGEVYPADLYVYLFHCSLRSSGPSRPPRPP